MAWRRLLAGGQTDRQLEPRDGLARPGGLGGQRAQRCRPWAGVGADGSAGNAATAIRTIQELARPPAGTQRDGQRYCNPEQQAGATAVRRFDLHALRRHHGRYLAGMALGFRLLERIQDVGHQRTPDGTAWRASR
ncbi:MAG: hypothetical protein IPL03_15485 [Sterolibacteriaceae bacterium]|nr:hypothetical protein [Candidatus Methylophosphatis haderslevensis]